MNNPFQEIPRKDKLGEKSRKPPYSSMLADPRRELAESLPLCHPNDDYLKDFTPMQGLDLLFLDAAHADDS